MKKIEHIGIAVKDLEASNQLFQDLLGVAPYKTEHVENESVMTSFFMMGDTKLELLQATNDQSAIAKFLVNNREGLHHIAFDVDDINAEIERLKNLGHRFINEIPKEGADNKLIVFLHPKSTNGVLVELCQDKKS